MKIFLLLVLTLNSFAAVDNDIVNKLKFFLKQNNYYKSDFVQKDKNGVVHEGNLIIDKKHEYILIAYTSQPITIEILNDFILMKDLSINETTKIPTKRTPIRLLLKNDIEMSKLIIHETWKEGGLDCVKLQDKIYRDQGIIDICFNGSRLKKIDVKDYINKLICNLYLD